LTGAVFGAAFASVTGGDIGQSAAIGAMGWGIGGSIYGLWIYEWRASIQSVRALLSPGTFLLAT